MLLNVTVSAKKTWCFLRIFFDGLRGVWEDGHIRIEYTNCLHSQILLDVDGERRSSGLLLKEVKSGEGKTLLSTFFPSLVGHFETKANPQTLCNPP